MKYTTLDFRPLNDYELRLNRECPAGDYCSTPKCDNTTTHVRIVEYQHYSCGRRNNGRREKRLRLCAECAARFASEYSNAQ